VILWKWYYKQVSIKIVKFREGEPPGEPIVSNGSAGASPSQKSEFSSETCLSKFKLKLNISEAGETA